jgi:hypothetical protein
MPRFHFERALFVVGKQDSGKSKQLRSMFRDWRLGTKGVIPTKKNLPDIYHLSNERSLYLRLTSPHEMDESLPEFLEGLWDKFTDNTPSKGRRWNAACALQPFPEKKMRSRLPTICKQFGGWFEPERIRIAFLSPDRHDKYLQEEQAPLTQDLIAIPGVEICWIDARDREASGLLLADYFDFT